MPLLNRNAQIACKVESTPGTAETLTAAEAKGPVYSPSYSNTPAMFKRKPARGHLSGLPAITTKEPASLRWQQEFKGSGAVGTAPSFAVPLLGCGAQQAVLKTIAIGSVTSGPFIPMETITGGTSSATGRVCGQCTATPLKFIVLTGTFQSGEVITGGTSGATATSGGTPTDAQGFEWTPDSSALSTLTLGYFLDGQRKLLAGAQGNCDIAFSGDGIGMMEFNFSGVNGGVTDTALLSGVTYESTTPFPFKGVTFNLGGNTSAVVSSFTMRLGNTVAERPSVTSTRGILSYYISDREPMGAADPEAVAVATDDFYGKVQAGTTGRFYLAMGTGTGQVLTVASPRIRFTSIGEVDRSGIAAQSLDFEMLPLTDSTADGEWQITLS